LADFEFVIAHSVPHIVNAPEHDTTQKNARMTIGTRRFWDSDCAPLYRGGLISWAAGSGGRTCRYGVVPCVIDTNELVPRLVRFAKHLSPVFTASGP
jgi:hypothetical protein